ncbi:MAG: hypothetical protein R3E09_11260 [Novosphingobium sp.]
MRSSCLIGDWLMQEGDILISAAELEYGPLVISPEQFASCSSCSPNFTFRRGAMRWNIATIRR